MDNKGISRRCFLSVAAAGCLASVLGCNLRYKVSSVVANYGFPRKPNVILVMSDDQGYGDMACHGNPVVKTPNIDRFYKESSRFGKFFVSPFDRSTQASLLTGRNVPAGRELSQEDVSLAKVLAGAGYKTCIAGSWDHPHSPMDEGFDEVFYYGGGGKFSPTINHNGIWQETDGYCTDKFFDAAMRFIEENRDEPFFCYLSTNAAHSPYEVDEKYSAQYREQGFGEDVANFYGMIANLDENLGRLVKRVKDLGLEQNTLIIFMTDNGSAMADKEGLFNAGMRGGKGSFYEGGSRAASFWRMPGTLKPNRTVEQMAMHYDIIPTLMAICDAKHPEPQQLEGINLIPYLVNFKQKEKDRLFVTYAAGAALAKNGEYSVRTSRFRLINDTELYDVNANPSETINVIESYPAEVARIRSAYNR